MPDSIRHIRAEIARRLQGPPRGYSRPQAYEPLEPIPSKQSGIVPMKPREGIVTTGTVGGATTPVMIPALGDSNGK